MQANDGNSLAINGRISKGFDWKLTVISTEALSGKSTSKQMRQNKLVDYKSQWIQANAAMNMKPFQWLIIDYKASWGHSQAKASTGEQFSAIQSLKQRIMLDILLPFDINLNYSFEHYYNSAAQHNKIFSLTDAAIVYTYKGIRFSLDWTNILNTATYVSKYYDTLNSYYSEYNIRQMAVMLKVNFRLV
jgi:hypothetical protein